MVASWLAGLRDSSVSETWTVYAETAGWDLLLIHRDGYQLGLEAKLGLNAHVVAQALEDSTSVWKNSGPDYRGVLVPEACIQNHITPLARALGIGVIPVRPGASRWSFVSQLPDEKDSWRSNDWPNWCPEERCQLPDYVPDVEGGKPAPVALTPWKVKAIKLMILLERRGRVTRGDMKALQISPTRWTDHWHGFLRPSSEAGGHVRCDRTPDLKAQHPVNWAQIEADYEKWLPPGYRFEALVA